MDVEKTQEEPIVKDIFGAQPKQNEMWIELAGGKRALQHSEQKYSVFSASLNYSRKIGRINKLGIGLDFIHDNSLTDRARERYDYTGEADINFRVGPNVHGEFLFGNASFIGAYGFYFCDNTYYVSRAYYKAGAKYRFKNFVAQAMVRAVPLFKAEVITFGLGYTFYSF
jgi:hypothetical protein